MPEQDSTPVPPAASQETTSQETAGVPSSSGPRVSRRGLLTTASLVGAGAIGAAASYAVTRPSGADAQPAASAVVPFHGEHQAGIVTPVQDRLHIAAFDVTATTRDDVIGLLKDWTAAAEAMAAGREAGEGGAVGGDYEAPPSDTGEAMGLSASNLTITFGFGRTFFLTDDGAPRFGLSGRLPEALIELPHFPGDQLEPQRTGGDLVIQACADDPQVAVHAIRNLSRIAFGRARLRWSQLGFGRTSSTSTSQQTPRNLFGFKDGTANLKAEEPEQLAEHVWVAPGGKPGEQWMVGGSYLVARRIRMHIEVWDRTSLGEQEAVIGRTKSTGAPLSGGQEFTEPNFEAKGRGDAPLIAMDSHVRLAHAATNKGVKMLRRGFNFTDGNDSLGRLDAGLFFIAFVRDPRTQFVPMQNRLASSDRLSVEYLKHTGSGLFAVPPGIKPGEYVGQGLFA
ncbi:iron uptake transporter deferrochelatase/peroxidase subunit [Arthrobacter woluwensis]|uniref:iron uptake transporter deferrochelatase/peroxidase subunit n=1 Tax=Arthrobacter woluwensis TaxID=156980 RepID=UPI0011AA04BA|nr:iron uptake transporter deferrochelatase/peroxidase subunit [Arthrobacter woluwensis]